MKRTTKRAIIFLLALCMILALAGCGKKKTGTDAPAPSAGSSTQTPGTTTQEPVIPEPALEPEAVVDPEDMKWGYENDGSNDYGNRQRDEDSGNSVWDFFQ